MQCFDGFIGIDECGRGNIFGPCIFVGVDLKAPPNELSFAVDSKTTTKNQRIHLYSKILPKVNYRIIQVPPQKIDKFGLSVCIKEALLAIIDFFGDRKFIYDGNCSYGIGCSNFCTQVKADSTVVPVSCASIIAKYSLDVIMREYHIKHPEYGFDAHSGYTTLKHIDAIKQFGMLEDHRRSYHVKGLEIISKDADLLF